MTVLVCFNPGWIKELQVTEWIYNVLTLPLSNRHTRLRKSGRTVPSRVRKGSAVQGRHRLQHTSRSLMLQITGRTLGTTC